MRTLYLIPARGGSKGLPGKNIKLLQGKPLLIYSVDVARTLTDDANICISTDSKEIISVAEQHGLKVPFVRPAAFSSDKSSSQEVIIHALDFYRLKGTHYDCVVLLQPTSPFRNKIHVSEMISEYSESMEMIVSVNEAHQNPYFSLFEENQQGYLTLSKPSSFTRRQDCPKVYAFNGSVYVINANSIYRKAIGQFERVKKYVMDEIHSVDIDNHFDWLVAEMILEKKLWVRDDN